MNDPNQQAAVPEQFAEERISVGLPWRILMSSGVIFALTIFVAVGLKYGYATYLDSQIEAADKQLSALTASITEEKQQEFVTFYSQVVNIKSVLEKRSFSANALSFLEQSVIGSTYFTGANMNAVAQTIELDGYATNLEALSAQIATLERSPAVKNVVLNDVALRTQGGVTFKISVSFVPAFLQAPISS